MLDSKIHVMDYKAKNSKQFSMKIKCSFNKEFTLQKVPSVVHTKKMDT